MAIREGILNTQVLRNLQDAGERHIERMDLAVRVFAAIALALFALTIVFIILACYEYVHPAASLFSFAAILPTVCIAAIIRCCRQPVANRHHFDLTVYDNTLRENDLHLLRQQQHRQEDESNSDDSIDND